MELKTCPHCEVRVAATPNGTCPSCRKKMDLPSSESVPGEAPAAQSSATREPVETFASQSPRTAPQPREAGARKLPRSAWIAFWMGLAVAAVCGIAFLLPPTRAMLLGCWDGERFSHGMPCSFWVHALQHDADSDRIKSANAALGDLGTDAIPALLAAVAEAQDASVRARIENALIGVCGSPRASDPVPALIEGMRSNSPVVRVACAKGLAALGQPAKAAQPTLIGALADEATSKWAVVAMCRSGLEANTLAAIIRAGWGPLPPTTERTGLGNATVTAWSACQGGSERVRDAFFRNVSPNDPAVWQALQSPDNRVRWVIAGLLSESKHDISMPPPRPLLDALRRAADDPDERVQYRAKPLLEILQFDRWLADTKDGDWRVRLVAALGLGTAGPQARAPSPTSRHCSRTRSGRFAMLPPPLWDI